ncbi:sensor histidine kinase [Arenivirga flava]|uniref:histidine kinase n=1 Tax=Arenivirga flava TaxID=1930060 RepID=A0AA37XCN1_9MICO|nr:ATP-binding protein [Arenivirga flava]GMA28502.1 sensor histidine kinase [Arenivirga flava]
MARGRLRVLLGAAPGVGKTYAMLEEGRRLADEGADVVVAVVETHGRAATAAMLDGLEVLPRVDIEHRGVRLDEMDLDGLLARAPGLALVDELAHTNAPGSQHAKRWQDVDAILAAGIDVISTVNIQHIESLNDVVHEITGAPQRETIPDAVLRSADQVELVDLAPQALRDRLAGGRVYPAERIDAALSNYFRIGNLTALRELALLWLADDVDAKLTEYRRAQGIEGVWEARERVVVALTGGPEGETLLRRGARIAARSGSGELLAVHVTSQDGLRAAHPEHLAAQRALVEQLGGSYHQVIGGEVPAALIDFARGVNATQLVIGVSRRSRPVAAVTGPGVGAAVIRDSGPIDVHIVNHDAAGRRFALPRLGGALSRSRLLAGALLALTAGPLLTWLLATARDPESITLDVLAYSLLVVVVALVGGLWPALFAAVLSGLTLDFLFIEPYYTISVDHPLELWALVLYVVNALLVSWVVDTAARRTRLARRAAAESELLATVAGSVLRGQGAVQALISRTREAFGLAGVRLIVDGDTLATDGEPVGRTTRVPVGARGELELHGGDVAASERRLLGVIAAQLDGAVERESLSETAREVGPLAETDRVRTALLSAVSHDLRRPLAAARAAVTGLRTESLPASDRAELIDTADESLRSLAALLTDLLDVSRVQAGVLGVALADVDPGETVLAALDELGLGPGEVELDLALDGDDVVGAVRADGALLRRVLVNLLDNAARFAPPGERMRVTTSAFAGSAEIRVVDRGPGIPAERRDDVFVPFQRLGDHDNLAGLGLGLALAKGFAEGMGGALRAEETPGGGTTMVVTLPLAGASASARPVGGSVRGASARRKEPDA